ncbi:YncE family protein [Noviherbaspirillum massiliense]|uniref:YncE family protein n=1 Tax=Noviherbaspirillum massiliense TaxID=1465823 RepID=UPI0002EC6B39|nr:YncE family protein [Noviherbaspirillum massiliense]
MKWAGRCIAALALGLLSATGGMAEDRAEAGRPASPILRHVADYPLPGRPTRWDYMSLDKDAGRLYIAHLGDSSVVAIDTQTKAVLASVQNIGQVHGVLAVPELGRVYASATRTHEVVALDANTLKVTARIPGGRYPDGLAYAPEGHKLYVSDETGKSETVIDTQTNKRIATIPLGGTVGNTQYDSVSKHIFANVQGTNELAEIDPQNDTVIQRLPVPGAEGNHGLLIEPELRLAFIACEGNDRLLVMDLRSKHVVAQFAVGKAPDVLAYDTNLGLLYVAGEAGTVSVFRVTRQGVIRLGDQQVGANAHTVAVDPATHEVFFPLKEVGGRPVLRVMRPSF